MLFLPNAIHAGDYQKTAELVLRYYDKTYAFGLGKREESRVFRLRINDLLSSDIVSAQVLEFARQKGLTWKLSN